MLKRKPQAKINVFQLHNIHNKCFVDLSVYNGGFIVFLKPWGASHCFDLNKSRLQTMVSKIKSSINN